MKADEVERERENIKRRNEELQMEKKKALQEVNEKKAAYKQKAKESMRKRNQKSFWEANKDYFGYAILGLLFLFIIISNFTGENRKLSDISINNENYIIRVNDANGNYLVGHNELFEDMTLAKVREMANNRFSPKKNISRCNPNTIFGVQPPEFYNFYEQFSHCKTNETLEKNSSGYVQVAISGWRNRNCKAGGDPKFTPSLEYFYHCDKKFNTASKGGYIVSTLDFMLRNGIINEQCWNDIKTDDNKCPSKEDIKTCSKEYAESYCVFEKKEEIKKEIYKNGPVISFLPPYRDFLIYKKGYLNLKNKVKGEGMFFVKIVGWEVMENNEEYWIVDPLFGNKWGVNGVGYVKIDGDDNFLDTVGLSMVTSAQEKNSTTEDEEEEDDDDEEEDEE